MVSVLKFRKRIEEFQTEIRLHNDSVEASKQKYFIAARKIQAWFRGLVTRKHICMIHKQAIVIQCHWRGYYTRIMFHEFIMKKVFWMWQEHYDRMATIIQAIWRGYWSRKTRLNLRKKWQWLNSVYVKNKETLNNMKKFRQRQIDYIGNVTEWESLLWILFILFKVSISLHHLLRTKQRSGVITRIDKTQFTAIEEMLKCLKYSYHKPKKQSCEHNETDNDFKLVFAGTYFERCEREIRKFEEDVKAGNISLFRSIPYDENEKWISQENQICTKLSRIYDSQNRLSSNKMNLYRVMEENSNQSLNYLECIKNSTLTHNDIIKLAESNITNISTDELFDAIRKMNCSLNEHCIECPIHNNK